jgi:hypothetical protein
MRSTENSPSRGGIRLSVLIAALAALLLVPAAQAFANGTMKVNIEGSGNGEVSSVTGLGWVTGEEFNGQYEGSPPIECTYKSPGPATGVCEDELSTVEEGFFEGTVVHAIAAPGSEFVGWVVEKGGVVNAYCEAIEESKASCAPLGFVGSESEFEVTAIFVVEEVTEEFPLTVTPEGTGEGTVTSTPAGIECGSECEAEFEEGEEVELSQSAEPGSEFIEWGGACSGSGACEVTMSEAKEVKATFDLEPEPEEFALEISTEGSGEGEVSCEVEAGPVEPCEAEYEEGTEVALVPEAETGSEFSGWSEDCTGTGACELTMDEAHSVTATFDEEEEEPQPEEFNLTIVKAGTGSGSVTCNAGACAAGYEEGEEVTLAATAASGSTFTGFSGAGCSGTAPCTVAIEEDTTVTATFTANAKAEETCATNASLCPPPPPIVEGKAKAAATATVKSGKAALKLTCSGGPCKGTIQLKAKVKQGAKTKSLVIGKASFSIAEGATVTLKVKLSGPAKSELAKGKTLKAKTSGAGVSASTVKLKPAKK